MRAARGKFTAAPLPDIAVFRGIKTLPQAISQEPAPHSEGPATPLQFVQRSCSCAEITRRSRNAQLKRRRILPGAQKPGYLNCLRPGMGVVNSFSSSASPTSRCPLLAHGNSAESRSSHPGELRRLTTGEAPFLQQLHRRRQLCLLRKMLRICPQRGQPGIRIFECHRVHARESATRNTFSKLRMRSVTFRLLPENWCLWQVAWKVIPERFHRLVVYNRRGSRKAQLLYPSTLLARTTSLHP